MSEQIFIPIEEAAKILKVDPRTIVRMIEAKKLKAKNISLGKVRKIWRVLKSDLIKT